MEPSDRIKQPVLPCPVCHRLLTIPLTQSGKLGCRRCHTVFNYDAKANTLTPLTTQASSPPRKSIRLKWLFSGITFALLLLCCIFYFINALNLLPGSSPSSLDEARELLKSLAE